MIEWFLDSDSLSLMPLSRQEAWVKPDQVHSFALPPGLTEGLGPEPTQGPGRTPPPAAALLKSLSSKSCTAPPDSAQTSPM